MSYKLCNNHTDLSYRQDGDYYLPNLTTLQAPIIGRFGRMRFQYLRDHRECLFNVMLLNGALIAHMDEIDRQAQERLDLLTIQLTVREGVTEQLKAADQMEWVRRMNSIRARAEEVVLNELIYV